MNLRVTLVGKVKYLWYGAEVKASLNRAVGVTLVVIQQSAGVDAKPSDLPMARLKFR